MDHFLRQPAYYPTSVVFVDDNGGYQNMLRRIVPQSCIPVFYNSPRAAIDFLVSHVQRTGAVELLPEPRLEPEDERGDFYERLDALGGDMLKREARFDEISAVVVDYHMPEVDGIELLSSIHRLGCHKILLTGVADESLAVEAFNARIVDYYLKKSDPEFVNKLLLVLARAQKAHCARRGLVALSGVGSTYCEPAVAVVLERVVREHHIAEYYWRPDQNAVLMFGFDGTPSVFLAWDTDEWAFQCDVVSDEDGPAWLREAMLARQTLPVFWPARAFSGVPDSTHLVRPRPVPGREGTFYAWAPLSAAQIPGTLVPYARSTHYRQR